MTDLDQLLERLRDEPPPARLALIDDAVMTELAKRRAIVPINRTGLALAAATAIFIGGGGSILSGTTAGAAPIAPLGVPAALAPSTLLTSR
jgi:anti-sigma factor RsiW